MESNDGRTEKLRCQVFDYCLVLLQIQRDIYQQKLTLARTTRSIHTQVEEKLSSY